MISEDGKKLYTTTDADGKLIGIPLWEIMKVLGYYKRDTNGNRNLGMIIKNAEINRFAKYKPFNKTVGNPSEPATEEERLDAGYGLQLQETVIDLPLALGTEVIYTYPRPTEYRVLDFNGYNRNPVSPMDFRLKKYTNRESINGAFYDDNDFPQWVEIDESRFLVVKFNEDSGDAFDWEGFIRILGTSSVTFVVYMYNKRYDTTTEVARWIHGDTIPSEIVVTKGQFDNEILRGDDIKIFVTAVTSDKNYVAIAPNRYSIVQYYDGLEYEVTNSFNSGRSIGTDTSGSQPILYWNTNTLAIGLSDNLMIYSLTLRNDTDKTLTQSSLYFGITVDGATTYSTLHRGAIGTLWSLEPNESISNETFVIPYYNLNTALGSSGDVKTVTIGLYTLGKDPFNNGVEKYFSVSEEFNIKVRRP